MPDAEFPPQPQSASDASDPAPPPPRWQQLALFAAESPLELRLGASFFRAIPSSPGVYSMWGEHRKLLYLGKAKNLRQRLNSYRYCQNASRKTRRLVHRVRSISWDLCETERDALLRENDLLRTLRPPFNRMHTWPAAYYFLLLHEAEHQFRLELTRDQAAVDNFTGSDAFGALKGSALPGYHAFLRLFWAALNRQFHPDRFPRSMLLPRPPRTIA